MSTVPSLSFCSSSLSPPSWLEPKTTTLALPPSLALARRANSSADVGEQRARLADVAELDLDLRERGKGGGERDARPALAKGAWRSWDSPPGSVWLWTVRGR